MLKLEKGDVLRSVEGPDMILLIVSERDEQDQRCVTILVLDACWDTAWQPGEIGPVARTALRRGGWEKVE